MPEKVALLQAANYDHKLAACVFKILDATGLRPSGQNVLVKPNLLMADELCCANALVTSFACQWLLDHGARVKVCDSPAFGTCVSVAQAIGLTDALKPLGLKPANFSGAYSLRLPAHARPKITIGREAANADLILSIARVKAHSQMRITLSVKNCFGCVIGARKALAHVRFGRNVEYFADCIAALWAALPPVAGFCDGVLAMNITGPRLGQPYPLGIMGASKSAPALDAAFMEILNIVSAPVHDALKRRNADFAATYPLSTPGALAVSDFISPGHLKDISFGPLTLAKSFVRRFFADKAMTSRANSF